MQFGSVTLFDYQAEDVTRAMDGCHKSIFLAYEMALGKTITAVAYALLAKVKTVVVVAPKNTRSSWKKTIEAMAPGTPVYDLINDKKHVASFGYLEQGKPGWYIIGWEMMRTGAITGITADMIIGDEIHRIQNYGKSDTEKMFRHLNSEWKVALSGTPAANRPEGLFAPIHWLWPKRYASYYTHFIDKFWYTRRNGAVIDLIREREPGMIVNDLPFFVRRLKKDHRGDLPPVLPEVVIECPMTRAQKKIYKQFEETALAWLGDHPVATSIPLVQEIRLRQVAIAEPTVREYEENFETKHEVTFALDAKSSKIKALAEVVLSEDATFFVLTHSAKAIPAIIHQLGKAGVVARRFDSKYEEELKAELGVTYQVLVAGIQSVAEGLDGLQHKCSRGAWISKHPNAMLNVQAGERLDRPGQTESVQWWSFVAPDSSEVEAQERLDEISGNLFELYDRYS